jgi:hypothetical protein
MQFTAWLLMEVALLLIGLIKIEPVLLNVYGAPELIPRNEFRQPM